MKLKNDKTLNIALTAVFACIVFVLSYLGSFVHIGAISFALTLIPIVLGGIYIGPWAGAFLGAVFGLTVLCTDVTALALLSINWFYAFLGCVVRGVIAGWLPAFVFKIAAKKSETVGAVVASVLAPIINTGIFSLCVFTIFEPYFTDLGQTLGYLDLGHFVLVGLIGLNFVFEFLTTVVITPVLAKPLLALKKRMER